MIARVQLLRDDGTVLAEVCGPAHACFGWESAPQAGPVTDGGRRLWGFTYLPLPPSVTGPRDPADVRGQHGEDK